MARARTKNKMEIVETMPVEDSEKVILEPNFFLSERLRDLGSRFKLEVYVNTEEFELLCSLLARIKTLEFCMLDGCHVTLRC